MRSRSNSCHALDYYYNMVYRTILQYQDPVTGLLPAHQVAGSEHHAWVRDNVYTISAVWALALAYRRVHDKEEEKTKLYQLEQATVKCMRGLLMSMMGQREKVEKFKRSFHSRDSLHAKFSSRTGQPVVGDSEWGHLQIDAISLYLLSVAQMTASGLQIIFTLDEVAFIQNLVFYIECAYVTPDYGIWERGDKSNQSIVELNASSIGMAKAALEAMNKLDLFGARGGPASEIHVLPDEAVKCAAVLESMLPRESNSKETDAAILSIIGYPAFSVTSPELVNTTLLTIQEKLGGRYGMKRFLRDGYRTARENPNRLHYEPWELRLFENIECEWPLFYCYLVINYCFQGDIELSNDVMALLDSVTISRNGLKLVPELYTVPESEVMSEYGKPGHAERVPGGRCPLMWAQGLYIIGKLLHEEFIAPGELDPMNRRLSSLKKPDVVVQIVVLAEDKKIQGLLGEQGFNIKSCTEIAPIQVQPAGMLSHLYTFLGRSAKLGLSGRRCLDVGILATSKIYRIQGKTFVFTPQSFDPSMNYTDTDPSLAMSTLAYGLNYLSTSWADLGRPTVTLILSSRMLEDGKIPPAFISTLKKLSSGYINGTRVALGSHEDFATTSCFSELAFLGSVEQGCPDRLDPAVSKYLESCSAACSASGGILGTENSAEARKQSVGCSVHMAGTIKRSRSIIMHNEETRRELAEHLRTHLTVPSPDPVRKNASSVRPGAPLVSPAGPHSRLEMFTNSLVAHTNTNRDPGSKTLSEAFRQRLGSDAAGKQEEASQLVDLLRVTGDLEEQGDILHYMTEQYGLSFKITVTFDMEEDRTVTVEDLVKELYDAACEAKHWAIVRHSSGMLGKKLPSLALSVTDLIVRQKQVTVGLPPSREIIISRPLGAQELKKLIVKAHDGDLSTSSLSQEILIYLAMFIRTEPQLFHGMLRLRIGLIIQVMASELARTLAISGEEAADKLLNLSPYETKNLLHHIMSGQEYGIQELGSKCSIYTLATSISRYTKSNRQQSGFWNNMEGVGSSTTASHLIEENDRAGLWYRRRLLDGSLNRVPPGFYTRMWNLLEKCQGITIQGKTLPQSLTQEMTSGEMKFHLECEALLNLVPQPEYRQLVVEAILVLILVVEYSVVPYLGGAIEVERIVREGNCIFLEDQRRQKGDATLCCLEKAGKCGGAAGICSLFYDSAPSGTYGTISYLVRAACRVVDTIPNEGDIDCNIM